MNVVTRTSDTSAVRRILAILAVVSITFSLIALLSPALVSADGDDTTAECDLAENTGDVDQGTVTVTVEEDEIITEICIKSGENSFDGLKHSGLITEDGEYGTNDCFTVTGIGTNEVVVSSADEEGCHDVSHVDFTVGTPESPPASPPTSPPASPAGTVAGGNPTPSVRGAVQAGTPNTAMLPASDSSAPMILALLLTVSLVAVAYVNVDRVRRLRDDS